MKKYEIHPIANMYPMMSSKEHENLLNSMEDNGYDANFPIILYEGKILDGRNRYKACCEIKIEPNVSIFEGTQEEAISESRKLNSSRRHMPQYQRAMVAAFEIQKSRDDEKSSKLSIPKAALFHTVSPRLINDALKVLKEDQSIAQNVFNGAYNLNKAQYKINEIKRLKEPPVEEDEQYYEIEDIKTSSNLNNESVVNNEELSSLTNVSSQSSLKHLQEEIENLKSQLNQCRATNEELINAKYS